MLYLISLLSFLLPTQLGLHFDNFNSTVYGFKIDYLIPTLYLTDIIALLVILFGIKNFKFNKVHYKSYLKNLLFCIVYLVFVFINISNSLLIIPSIYKWLKVTELILLGLFIVNTKKFDVFKHFVRPLSYSVFIICLLGIAQFINKGSIGGIFYWLGERSFLFNDPNIAPYPYSTFSHPNSFAGFLLVFGIFLLQYRKKFPTKYFWTLLVLVGTNLFLTNSLNVYVTISFLLLLKFSENLLHISKTGLSFGLFIFDTSERFVTHRLELIKASLAMVKDNFWFGVGFNNFIPNLVKVSNTFVNAWELQPVHNIFILILTEIGFVGLVMFSIFIFSVLAFNNYALIAILTTGLSDHYWLTLQQNMLLFTYVLVISKKWKNKI